jgi:hypothetical protein
MGHRPGEKTRAEYRQEVGLDCADQFFDRIYELDVLVAKRGWPLRKQFNSYWCAFKAASNRAAFGIAIDRSSRDIYLYVKRARREAETFAEPMWRYNERDDQAEYFLKRNEPLDRFIPLLEVGFEKSPFGA